MSRLETRAARTPHGDVEYDVVTCTHCGEAVLPSDAVPVGIGTESYTCDGLPICRASHERPRDTHVLCAYCADAVLGYTADPDGVADRITAVADDTSALAVGLWLGIVGGVAIAVGLLVVQLLVGVL